MAIIDLPNLPLLLDDETNKYIGIQNPDQTVTIFEGSGSTVTSFNTRTGDVDLNNTDVVSVIAEAASTAYVATTIASTTANTVTKFNLSAVANLQGTPFSVTPAFDLQVEAGYSGLYEISIIAQPQGYNPGAGFASPNVEIWARGVGGFFGAGMPLSDSYALQTITDLNETVVIESKFYIQLSESDQIEFYYRTSTTSTRFNFVSGVDPVPPMYPVKILIKKISL